MKTEVTGLYSFTIHDNDYYNLMNIMAEYICKVLPDYLKMEVYSDTPNTEIIKDLIKEFLYIVHTDKSISEYFLRDLEVENVKNFVEENENSEVFYIQLVAGSASIFAIQ